MIVNDHYPLQLSQGGYGFALINSTENTHRHFYLKAAIFDIQPRIGSVGGGTVITVTGDGYIDGRTEVSVDGFACTILTVDYNEIVCATVLRPGDGDGPVEVSNHSFFTLHLVIKPNTSNLIPEESQFFSDNTLQVTVDGVNARCEPDSDSCNFVSSYDVTPTTGTVMPPMSSGGTLLEIAGTMFGTDASIVEVDVSGAPCEIRSVSDTQITCFFENGPVGRRRFIRVKVGNLGNYIILYKYIYVGESTRDCACVGVYSWCACRIDCKI